MCCDASRARIRDRQTMGTTLRPTAVCKQAGRLVRHVFRWLPATIISHIHPKTLDDLTTIAYIAHLKLATVI